MLTPRLTNCPECSTIPSLLENIECRLNLLAKRLYNNTIFSLNQSFDSTLMFDLLCYKRILMYKYINPDYAVYCQCTPNPCGVCNNNYSLERVVSKVNLLTLGCVKPCYSLTEHVNTTTSTTTCPSTTSTSTSSTSTSTTILTSSSSSSTSTSSSSTSTTTSSTSTTSTSSTSTSSTSTSSSSSTSTSTTNSTSSSSSSTSTSSTSSSSSSSTSTSSTTSSSSTTTSSTSTSTSTSTSSTSTSTSSTSTSSTSTSTSSTTSSTSTSSSSTSTSTSNTTSTTTTVCTDPGAILLKGTSIDYTTSDDAYTNRDCSRDYYIIDTYSIPVVSNTLYDTYNACDHPAGVVHVGDYLKWIAVTNSTCDGTWYTIRVNNTGMIQEVIAH